MPTAPATTPDSMPQWSSPRKILNVPASPQSSFQLLATSLHARAPVVALVNAIITVYMRRLAGE